jgi:hypothetical protein
LAADAHNHAKQSWVDVEVLVGVDMIQNESSLPECRKLSANLSHKLSSHCRLSEVPNSVRKHTFHPKSSVCIDKRRDFPPGKHSPAISQHKV